YECFCRSYKKGNRKVCGNCRGISLLSVVGKVYASILVDRVRNIVESVLGEVQCGFRPLRGCQDQIFPSYTKKIHRSFYERVWSP
ncbi:hypothetical protein GUG46_07945, partial [Xanthomonas citri pv. citri]|nr:hypothetical protein [Xanthomonas citri pv. citri]